MLVRAGSGAARWSSLALIALAEPRLPQLELVDILDASGGATRVEASRDGSWTRLGFSGLVYDAWEHKT